MIKSKQVLKVLILIFAVFIGAYLLKGPSYPSSFEVTDYSKNIQSGRKHDFSGATLVNLDDDLENEIFISGHGSSNLLLKRNNDKFFPMEITELLDPDGFTFSVTACDLDQDGRDEILILNKPDPVKNTSHARIVKYIGGIWKDVLPKDDHVTESIKNGYTSSCIDRKGNGKYGLAISNEDGKLSYLEMIDSKIMDIGDTIGFNLISKGRSVLGVPNALGLTNIFIGNENGPNFYFVNKGDGTFIEQAKEVGLDDPKFNARGMSLIDINYDDIPDVVYGNNFGPTRLMEQTREGKFKDVTPDVMKKSYAVNSAVVGDFNLDGFEDVYLNNVRGANKIFGRYENDWYELSERAFAEEEMFGVSTIAGDLDKNGSFDILNTHGDGSQFPITLYSIKPVNQWIKFSVKYESGGIPRGAIVRLRTNLRDHVRVISPGSGRFANYDYDVIFGFQKNESAVASEVILPSGKKVEFKNKLMPMSTNELIISLR